MNLSVRTLLVLAALAVPAVSGAQVELESGEEKKVEKKAPLTECPDAAKPAFEVLTSYLNAVKAKKWADAKKYIHPKTMQSIAERKKRLGDERHAMAPWAAEKTEYYLTNYRITGVKPGPMGAWVFEVFEDNFQVPEKGTAENDMANYLVGKSGGKWLVVDKKRNVTFTDDSVKFGYKGFFDPVETRKEEE